VLSAEAKGSTVDGKPAQGTAILVATGLIGSAIEKTLCAEGLSTATFEHVEEALEQEENDRPSMVVLWTREPSSSLARVIGTLRQRFQGVSVVVVCDHIERWEIRGALTAGAAGVVLYDQLDDAFGPCVQAVLAGQTCVPTMHSRQIEPPALSAREKQILGLVVMGYMNSQIAEQLFLAESTVKSHLSSAFSKLGVRSRNEATSLILDPENGLGLGILGLGGEPVGPTSTPFR
jgi:DNA-binding NarL/FixJ family response regulator